MPETVQTVLEVPAGYRSTHVARYLWQMDDQSRRLVEATRDMTAEELGWQLAPGANTMGMLLAHIAVAEAHLAAVGLEGLPDSDVPAVIGIRIEDDGLPLPPDGRPPAVLESRDIAFFHRMLSEARANTRRVAERLADGDLGRQVARTRPDGVQRLFNVDWVLYHMLEHESGHFGQILLLRHLYKTAQAKV